MGYQQTILKLKNGEFENMFKWVWSDESVEWCNIRSTYPLCVVEANFSFEWKGRKYTKGELCFIFGGDRHFQRPYNEEGLFGLPFVDAIEFIEDIYLVETPFSDKEVGEALDAHFRQLEKNEFEQLKKEICGEKI